MHATAVVINDIVSIHRTYSLAAVFYFKYMGKIKQKICAAFRSCKGNCKKENGESVLKGEFKVPDNKYSFGLELFTKFLLFVYFLIQLIYPFIIIGVEQENYTYNFICAGISLLGQLSQFFDMPDLVNLIHRLVKCIKTRCCSCDQHRKCKTFKNGCSWLIENVSESLVYPALICNLMGFINERTWEFNSGLDYFDMGLFCLGIFTDIVLKYIKKIWEYVLVKNTINQYINEMEADKKCKCAWCNVFNYTLFFLIFQTLMRITMLGIISCKLYSDVFGSAPDTEEGDYSVEGWIWFIIVAGWYLPTVSWFSFFSLTFIVLCDQCISWLTIKQMYGYQLT